MQGDGRGREHAACTVTQAMNAAKRGLEQIRLTVVGEVSEFNDKPGYKAAYFTIRDDACAMPCLMWRERYNASGVRLRPGMLVELTGNFSVYTAKGRMQFSVASMRPAGEGDLRMQVARLAAKLEAQGLMAAARKRALPALPGRIGVVTSPRGKAVHDVLRTLRRRYPLGEVVLFGVPVEGVDAPRHLQEGLRAAYAAEPACDVILLVRGGGSYEDLMPFNDEGLARAVAESPVPVVTGIGHEPDNSIADMVADRRCSTPTAAAEAIAPDVAALAARLDDAARSLDAALAGCMRSAGQRLARLADRPVWHDPRYLTGGYHQQLDLVGGRLRRAIPDAFAADAHVLELACGRLRAVGAQLVQRPARQLALSAAKLDALSPLKTLSRGYSITYAADGRSVIDSVERVDVGDSISVRMRDGSVRASVSLVERQG